MTGGTRRTLPTRLAWRAYDVAMAAVVWLALAPWELLRGLAARSAPGTLAQRLGRVGAGAAPRGAVLVHAVSVGEVAAAGALVRALLDLVPNARLVLTTGNRAGLESAEVLQRDIPAVLHVTLLPWDRRAAMRRWLARLRPRAVVVVETEIWPNLFRACAGTGVPLLVASGRVYPRDRRRYRALRWFFRDVLAAVDWIGAQSDDEKDAFVAMGAPPERIEVTGNLKLDIPPARGALPECWRGVLARSRPLILGGSTHRPEESWLMACLSRLRETYPGCRLVLAPRHPWRCRRLARQARAADLTPATLSVPGPEAATWDVLLVDRFGVLPALYPLADVAFIGGTLAGRGGQSPIEAGLAGCPMVIGPSTEHFRHLVDGLAQAGGLVSLPAAGDPLRELETALAAILADPSRRADQARRAAAHCHAARGAARRCAAALARRLDPTRPPG